MQSAGRTSLLSGVTELLHGKSCFMCIREVEGVCAHLTDYGILYFFDVFPSGWAFGIDIVTSLCSGRVCIKQR